MSKFANDLEKKIRGSINAIANGTKAAKGSGVNDLIKRLKDFDEAAAEELQKKYIEAVKTAAQLKKKFVVTDIEYDTDGEDVDLPVKLTIEIPAGMTDGSEIEEYISDAITSISGYCHKGFATTPEIEY